MNTPAANELIMVFLFILILFAFARYFWNLMSEAKKTNRYLEAQIKLLAEIAAKDGVDIDTVSNILAQAGINKIKL
jgi:hypothetical protein